MKYVLMMRSHDMSSSGHWWNEWTQVGTFKSEQSAKWEMQKCLEYNSRRTCEYKIIVKD